MHVTTFWSLRNTWCSKRYRVPFTDFKGQTDNDTYRNMQTTDARYTYYQSYQTILSQKHSTQKHILCFWDSVDYICMVQQSKVYKNIKQKYIDCTHSASSRGSRKGGTAGRVGRWYGGGEPVSCFDGVHEHWAAQNSRSGRAFSCSYALVPRSMHYVHAPSFGGKIRWLRG